MKKIILTLLLGIITIIVFAQKHNVTSAAITFKQFKGDNTEKLEEAKNFIDLAYNTESTSNDPKMFMYRAQIYLKIARKLKDKYPDAILDATASHIKCLQSHPKKKNKIIIYNKWPKEKVLEGVVQCAYKLFNQAIEEYNAGDYKRAIKLYSLIFEVFPYDEEDQLKRGNITKETVLYNSFFASNKMKDNKKSKEILQQLMDINFNEPAIYIHMSNIYLEEENTDKAIEYLTMGREMFEDDQGLINTEINLYIQLGKTSELIGKLGEAIEIDPENDLLYFNRGTIYDQEGEIEKAEADYKTALEINPNSFATNYNIGALYFNYGAKINGDASNASSDSKYKALKKQATSYFDKALPYLETALDLGPEDKNTILSLKQLYALKGDYDKSNEMKKSLAELK
jgi:tetratricopeptide (TPR) repeat protein